MKKFHFVCFFLSLILLFGSVSCNLGDDESTSQNSSTQESIIESESESESVSSSENESSGPCEHSYQLSEDGTSYVCTKCQDSMPSGSGTLNNGGGNFEGEGYNPENEDIYDMQSKNYLFIGSSLANGFHSSSDNSRTSMATMMRGDYLTADYTIFENGALKEYKSVYLRKVSSPYNDGNIAGTYSWGSHKIVLNSDGSALFNSTEFNYYVNGSNIVLNQPIGILFSFKAVFRLGDTVYKYTCDGNPISAYGSYLDPNKEHARYESNGNQIAMGWSSTGYEGSKTKYERSYVCQLLDAIHDLGTQKIDKVFIQLSTNDIGQFIDREATTHLPFGTVHPTSFDINDFDLATSFGSMEYMVAKIKEQWKDAEIVIFSCWMMDSDWNTFKSSGKTWDEFILEYSNQANYDNVSEYAKMRLGLMQIIDKWDIGYIDCWADYELNAALNGENKSIYKSDSIHLTMLGYEKNVFGIFRQCIDGTYENWEV